MILPGDPLLVPVLTVPLGTFLYFSTCFHVQVAHSISLVFPCTYLLWGSLVCGLTRFYYQSPYSSIPSPIISHPSSSTFVLKKPGAQLSGSYAKHSLLCPQPTAPLSAPINPLQTGTGSDSVVTSNVHKYRVMGIPLYCNLVCLDRPSLIVQTLANFKDFSELSKTIKL